jgi:hypothetical protein
MMLLCDTLQQIEQMPALPRGMWKALITDQKVCSSLFLLAVKAQRADM